MTPDQLRAEILRFLQRDLELPCRLAHHDAGTLGILVADRLLVLVAELREPEGAGRPCTAAEEAEIAADPITWE